VGVGRIPSETIEAIRDRVDIVDLVGRYVALRRAGRSFKGLCPFHSEKTPSFQVNPELDIFHCFGCGEGGNAFGFLMRHENLTFPEAVRLLGREVGIEIPEAGTEGESGSGERLRDANELAQRVYRAALAGREGELARSYLAGRGLDLEAAERFGLGYAPDRWDAVASALARAKTPVELGERAGLLAPRRSGGHYDRLRHRLTFPIRDVRGRVIGFGGRALAPDQEPKYLNTPETPVFRKREAFYGLPDALEAIRRQGRAVVVEGYFDRIALERAGVAESLATCGTALTPEHARNLRRRTREVVLLFDGDDAGRRAALRSLEVLLPEGLRVRAGALPAGDDPDTFLAREGADALRRLVDEAPPALEGAIRSAVAAGCATPWQKADAVATVARLLVLVQDPVERGEYARRLSWAADVRIEDVDAAVRRERAGSHAAAEEIEPPAPARRAATGPEARVARRLVRLLLDHGALAARLDLEEFTRLLPASPWDALVPALAEAAGGERLDVAELAGRLEPDAGSELLALAVADEPRLAPAEAEGAFDDTLRWLRRRRQSEARRATTRQLRDDPQADGLALLAEKQRQIEERRTALGLAPGLEHKHAIR
jgi:DNA primase